MIPTAIIAPFKRGDVVLFARANFCVVDQCFDAVGGWRVIIRGPRSAGNPMGLYDFPTTLVERIAS